VTRLFDSVPAHGADPRQQQYRDTVEKAIEHFKSVGVEPIEIGPLTGFAASHVDLGWIQDQLRAFVRATAPSYEELVALIEAELPLVVQRVKEINVGNIGWPDVVEIAFETKDDASSYFYRLFVPLVD
jgi:hypothetical protein